MPFIEAASIIRSLKIWLLLKLINPFSAFLLIIYLTPEGAGLGLHLSERLITPGDSDATDLMEPFEF
jgi:hypothetical protein